MNCGFVRDSEGKFEFWVTPGHSHSKPPLAPRECAFPDCLWRVAGGFWLLLSKVAKRELQKKLVIASVAGRLLRALVVCEEDANLFGDIYHFSLWAVVKVEKEQCKLEKENICLHSTSCALLEQTHFKRVTFHFEAECSPSPVSVTPLQFCCCWRVVCDCFHSSLLSTSHLTELWLFIMSEWIGL